MNAAAHPTPSPQISRQIRISSDPDLGPERILPTAAALLAEVGRRDRPGHPPDPILWIARLREPAVLLGRLQRAASALALPLEAAGSSEAGPPPGLPHESTGPGPVRTGGLPVGRRAGGGRALRAGAGTVIVLFALPYPGALLPRPVPIDRVINRYVRGLNAGLALAGVPGGGFYPGRDFVTAGGGRIAAVAQEAAPRGPVLFEAVLAVNETLALPDRMNGYPEDPESEMDRILKVPEERRAARAWSTLSELRGGALDFEEIADALRRGYARTYDCSLVALGPEETGVAGSGAGAATGTVAGTAAGSWPPVLESEEGFARSGVADVPIGYVEALVRPLPAEGAPSIGEVRLRGDFMAPAWIVRELELALAGCPLEFLEVGRRIDAAFRRPGAFVHGLDSLRILAEAVLEAGKGV